MAIPEILLVSEKFVKSTSNISDNVAGKFLLPSIREAQEVYLRAILGDCLLDSVKGMVLDGSIEDVDAAPYRQLIDKCKYYLSYEAIVLLIPRVSYKIGNFGLAKSNDENLQVATATEIAQQTEFYQGMADSYCLALQGWMYENRAAFPELRECDCKRIKANLYSAATCGVWLGGPRGKKMPGGGGCCNK